MDLWIRSQDREKLCEIKNIRYMDMSEDYEAETHSLWNDNLGILGVYKTKDRALEVLDEIQELLEPVHITDISKKEGIIGANILYEMPEE